MAPLVSILIPAYNCEAWVKESIRSALAQSWPNKEVIVLDDGSTDRTLEVICSFGSEIRYESRRMGGQNLSRNRLTELSRGEWLAFLDADDELAADNIERKMEYADKADVIYGSTEIATFEGRTKSQSSIHKAINFEDPVEAAFEWRFPNTSAMMFKREALSSVGGWPTNVENCTDFAVYFPLLLAGRRFRAAPDALSLYRQWSPTQAVREKPFRLVVTHLDLLWWAAQRFSAAGTMTPQRLEAWSDRTMGGVRTLYQLDRSRVAEYLERIHILNPGYRPGFPIFPRGYSIAYRLFGFYAAEWLAEVTRAWRNDVNRQWTVN
jgi:glycosyltransferase involved in cell wall biosynthesis